MQDASIDEVLGMLLAVTRSLVDHPDELEIACIEDGSTVLFRIDARAADFGKLIGLQGRTARALRIILAANARRLGRALRLDIVRANESADEDTAFANTI